MFKAASCLAAVVAVGLSSPRAHAHAGHGAQAPGIIDPLSTHHAVLEDELKLNYAGVRGPAGSAASHEASLEVAYAFTDELGVEAFVPASLVIDGARVYGGLGDVELQAPKFSFVRERALVVTALTAFRLPTGEWTGGVGEPGTTIAPHLLVDVGFGHTGVQTNAAVEVDATLQEVSAALEGRLSLAHSFVLDDDGAFVVSPVLEALAEVPLAAPTAPELMLGVGAKIAVYGWHVGAGVVVPLRPEDDGFALLVQAGYHVRWEELVGIADG